VRGGTRRHGKGWGWFFSAPDPATGKRRFYSRNGFSTKKAAQEALSAELARFHNGAFVEPSKLTVEAFLLEQWLPAVQGRLRPSTRANYQTNLQVHIIPALGSLKLQRLTAPRIASFYSELLADGRRDGKGLAPKTVRNIHALLHRALKDAARWGYVPHNRADDVDPPHGASPSGKSGALSSCVPSSRTCATIGCTRSGSSWPPLACAGPSSRAFAGATLISPGPG
jgi:Phage integrase, N-terminal SAM-like domain/Arm DNA-binding domain